MSSHENGCEPNALGRLGLTLGSWLTVVERESGDSPSVALLPLASSVVAAGLASAARVSAGVQSSRGTRGSLGGAITSCDLEYPGAVEGGAGLSPTLCLMDCISRASSSSLLYLELTVNLD